MTYLADSFLLPFLIKQFAGYSKLLSYIIPILIYLIEALALNILFGPLSVGLNAVHLDLVRGDGKIKISHFFYGFREFWDNFQIGMMYLLHTLLWSLLFIIPGIYMSYSYAMAFYVKKDHPEYTWKQCFDESELLMDGNRWKLFTLQLSFIGWFFLGAIAFFGIGSLWVYPYQAVSTAVFYDDIKRAKL